MTFSSRHNTSSYYFVEIVFTRFIHCKITYFSRFHTILFGGIPTAQVICKGWELYTTSLKREYLHKLIRILLHGRFICSSIYLYQYEFMDIYFMLQVLIQYYFITLFIHILNCSSFGHWEFFHISLCKHLILWHTSINFYLFVHFA